MEHVATITGPENGGNMILPSDGANQQICSFSHRTYLELKYAQGDERP